MYETKIIIPTRQGRGIAGLAVAPQGPSLVERGTKVAIGLLAVVLLYTALEPYVSGSSAETRATRLEADLAKLAGALERYEKVKGDYETASPDGLKGGFLDEIPVDPWGNDYVLDPFWKRIICKGPNGQLETRVLVLGGEGQPDGGDDRVHYWRASGRLWYVRNGDKGGEVVRMSPDGLLRETLGVSLGADVADAAPRPDGKQVAISAGQDEKSHQVFLCGPDGQEPHAIVEQGDNQYLAWTADGATLVYQSQRSGTESANRPTLFYFSLVTRMESRLTKDEAVFGQPRCHPTDPQRLVAVTTKFGAAQKVAELNLAKPGGEPQRLSSGSEKERRPVWAGDGAGVLFLASTGGEDGEAQVFRVDGKTHEVTKLTNVPGAKVAVDASPLDGRLVLVVKDPNETFSILVVDPKKELVFPVVTGERKIRSIRWAP